MADENNALMKQSEQLQKKEKLAVARSLQTRL